jgi:hypothetical protein
MHVPPATQARSRRVLVAIGAGTASTVWLIGLSGWLGVRPGSVLLQRQNVLFNSDTNLWIQEMVWGHKPLARAVHPLQTYLWRPPCALIGDVLGHLIAADQAGILAARVVVAAVAGIGTGCLALVASDIGLGGTQQLLLFAMYLGFTVSSTIALPEHFGISNGLLAMTFAVPILVRRVRLEAATLTVLAVLCGGTTITNVLFPIASIWRYCITSARVRRAMVAALLLTVTMTAFFYRDAHEEIHTPPGVQTRAILTPLLPGLAPLYLRATMIDIYVTEYLNLRLIRAPASAAAYALFAVMAPAVGPPPLVATNKGADMVSYEPARHPVRLAYYWAPQLAGAAAWILLLALCSYHAARDPQTRPWASMTIGWITFNALFHNIWGDELLLYSAHWSWGLMALVVLGARHLSRVTIALLVALVVSGQVYTLLEIRAALDTIVR